MSYFAKKKLKREVSEPDAAGGGGFNEIQADFRLKEFIHSMKLEANIFRGWKKAALSWQTSKETAEYQWHSTDAAALGAALDEAMTHCFGVFRADALLATTATTSWALKSAMDYYSVTSSANVGFMNCTYMGSLREADLIEIATHIANFVNNDSADNCFILIAPNVGLRGGCKVRDNVRKVARAMELLLKDDSKKLEVTNFSIVFNPATAYSAKTSLRQEAFLLLSDKANDTFHLTSRWAKSALYLREAMEEPANFLVRGEFMNPTAKELATKHVPSGHVERELKQYVTGPGVYIPLLKVLLAGMSFKANELISIIDYSGYDGQLAKSVISLMQQPPAKMVVPHLSVTTHVWHGSRESNANTMRFCINETRGNLKEAVKLGMKLKGYTPLPPLKTHGDMPAINLETFHLSVPNIAEMTLKVKQAEFEKLTHVEKAKSWLADFNAEFNPKGGFFTDHGASASEHHSIGHSACQLHMGA